MSKRRRGIPSSSARVLASSVLPTPVGPTNKKFATGLSLERKPARERFTALVTPSMAVSWPKIFFERISSKCRSFSVSFTETLCSGILAVFATILSMSERLTSGKAVSSRPFSSASFSFFSLSALILIRAPASSIRSMALSGKNLSLI